MRQTNIRLGFVVGLALLPALAMAGKSKRKVEKTPPGPIEVVVENACEQPLDVSIVGTQGAVAKSKGSKKPAPAPATPVTASIPAGTKSAALTVPATSSDWIYLLKIGQKSPTQLARLSLPPDSKIDVKIAACRGDRADVFTQLRSAPEPASPHATANVRFRARQKDKYLEYKPGAKGRFKALSIAMTRYKDVPSGDFTFMGRVRGGRKGPVMGTVRRTVKLAPAHRYLVELEVHGRDFFVSVEDEGLVKKAN